MSGGAAASLGAGEPPIEIRQQDADLVVVSKPAGWLVHRGERAGRDERFVLQAVSQATGRYVRPVHRLDRMTSGVLLMAFGAEAARWAQAALAAPTAIKEYLVLARGSVPDAVVCDRPLRSERGEPQPSCTVVRCVARFPESRASLLAIRLRTGRRHQIRRHLNHLGHHVIGDTTHGKGKTNRYFREAYGLPRQFVHARRLVLERPVTAAASTRVDVVVPLADELSAVLARMPDVAPEALERWTGDAPSLLDEAGWATLVPPVASATATATATSTPPPDAVATPDPEG